MEEYLKNIVIQNRTIIKMLQIVLLNEGLTTQQIERLMKQLQSEAGKDYEILGNKSLYELNTEGED